MSLKKRLVCGNYSNLLARDNITRPIKCKGDHMKAVRSNYLSERRLRRAKATAAYFQIGVSTLWHWAKTREGFPTPSKIGSGVTVFDLDEIERFLQKDR